MKAKVCYKDEIHRISNLPATYQDLTQLVSSIFHSNLPQSWALQYTDSDNDDIIINDEKDYEEFRSSQSKGSSALPKMFIVSADAYRPPEIVSEEENAIKSENKAEEEYQVIERQDSQQQQGIIEVKDEFFSRPIGQGKPMVETKSGNQVNRKSEIMEIPSPETPKIYEVLEPKRESSTEFITREPVEDMEEHKKEDNVYETRDPSINQNVKDEKIEGTKVYMDANDLSKLVSNMIDQSLPKIAQITQQQFNNEQNQSMNHSNSNILDSLPAPKPSASKIVHFGVRCNICQVSPIVGVRYRCTVCPNYNCCEFCEEDDNHAHDLVKIKQLEAPVYNPPKASQPVNIIKPVTAEEWMKFNPNCDSLVDELRRVRGDEKMKEMKEVSNDLKGSDKSHYDVIIEKAEKLRKCFPKADFDNLCIYVSDAPEDMSIEELVENWKLGQNE